MQFKDVEKLVEDYPLIFENAHETGPFIVYDELHCEYCIVILEEKEKTNFVTPYYFYDTAFLEVRWLYSGI